MHCMTVATNLSCHQWTPIQQRSYWRAGRKFVVIRISTLVLTLNGRRHKSSHHVELAPMYFRGEGRICVPVAFMSSNQVRNVDLPTEWSEDIRKKSQGTHIAGMQAPFEFRNANRYALCARTCCRSTSHERRFFAWSGYLALNTSMVASSFALLMPATNARRAE